MGRSCHISIRNLSVSSNLCFMKTEKIEILSDVITEGKQNYIITNAASQELRVYLRYHPKLFRALRGEILLRGRNKVNNNLEHQTVFHPRPTTSFPFIASNKIRG